MAIFSVYQVFSVVVFSLFLVGILNNLLIDTENECEMTYMFEYPQFVKIRVPDNELNPQYGLYAYSEGRFTERARKMRFSGVPVLFIPGNVGSYKQVRSLASVALRKAISSSKYGFHFDYFTVDFNDEKSALFGGILDRQTEFTSNCLKRILDLYQSNLRFVGPKPTSVIVIGHSMGGVIARALLVFPENRPIVNLILTLASPHEMPVLNLDYDFDRFYQQIDQKWTMKTINVTKIVPSSKTWSSKVFITIGGGVRDLLVPSYLTSSSHSDINTLTTSIPGVWLSTDHLCIVWCKQLVLVLNRFLFEIVNPSTKQLTDETSHIVNMGKHFLKVGHSKNASYYNNLADFIPDGVWHEDSRRSYSFTHHKGVLVPHYYMVRLVDMPDDEEVSLEVVDVEDKDWIFGCTAKYVHGQFRVCLNGRHLSGHGYWVASREGKRRMASLDLKAFRLSYPQWTHIILRISPTHKKVRVNVDIHRKDSRTVEANLPGMYDPTRRTIITETLPNALRYNITLPGFDMLYQAYSLYVEPTGNHCEADHASAKLSVPWAEGHEVYSFFTTAQRSPMRLRLLKGNPNRKNSSQFPSIELILDPHCSYRVSIAASPYDALGQLSRYYTTSLPSYLAAILLLVLRHSAITMKQRTQEGHSGGGSFHSALCSEHVKPYYIILAARLGTVPFITIPFLSNLSPVLKVGVTASQPFVILPIFLHIVALGALHILGAGCWALLIFSGQLAHKILLRLLAVGKSGGGARVWEWAAGGLRKAPGAGGALLVALATGSCGAVALTAGAAFYFFLLTKMYEDYLEDLVYKTITKVAKKLRKKSSKKQETNEDKQKFEKPNSENVNEADNLNKSIKSGELKQSVKATTHKDNDNSPVDETKEKDVSNIKDSQIQSGDSDNHSVVKSDIDLKSDLVKKDDAGEAVQDNVEDQSQESVEVQPQSKRGEESKEEFSLTPLHFHFAMFFLWCLVTLLNVPALLTWAHNYKYNKMLEPDPSYIPGLIMCTSAAVLWQIDAPKPNIKYYHGISILLYITSVIIIMVTPMALFRLNYCLPAIFAIITLHQLFPVPVEAESEESNNPPDLENENPEPTSSTDTNQGEPSQSTPGPKIASSLIEEETDLEKFRILKEKLESE